MMKNNLKLNSYTYNKYIKIPTQNNLREDEIRGATSIIGFLLSLIPVSYSMKIKEQTRKLAAGCT